jgi:hypothetical protein
MEQSPVHYKTVLSALFEEKKIIKFNFHKTICFVRITGFLDFSIVRNSKELETTGFQKLHLFTSSGEGSETPALLVPLERPNLHHWTED